MAKKNVTSSDRLREGQLRLRKELAMADRKVQQKLTRSECVQLLVNQLQEDFTTRLPGQAATERHLIEAVQYLLAQEQLREIGYARRKG